MRGARLKGGAGGLPVSQQTEMVTFHGRVEKRRREAIRAVYGTLGDLAGFQ